MTDPGAGLVKIDGLNLPEHVSAANAAGPDFVGMVIDFPASPRSLTVGQAAALAASSTVPVIAVVVEPAPAAIEVIISKLQPAAVQFSGGESPASVSDFKSRYPMVAAWKTVHLSMHPPDAEIHAAIRRAREFEQAGAEKLLIDARVGASPGGTGQTTSWENVPRIRGAVDLVVFLAGGLNPDNVARAIEIARPAGVDVSSGVESAPGVKDPGRMRAFVSAARAAFRAGYSGD